jgi:transcriptional regulator with XRE-family HTH domain
MPDNHTAVEPSSHPQDVIQSQDKELERFARKFGQHVLSLRRSRGLTQEELAEAAAVSADTVRRLEHGCFSPSLTTLRKLVGGLDIGLSTLFTSFELDEPRVDKEVLDLLGQLSLAEQHALVQFIRTFHPPSGSR